MNHPGLRELEERILRVEPERNAGGPVRLRQDGGRVRDAARTQGRHLPGHRARAGHPFPEVELRIEPREPVDEICARAVDQELELADSHEPGLEREPLGPGPRLPDPQVLVAHGDAAAARCRVLNQEFRKSIRRVGGIIRHDAVPSLRPRALGACCCSPAPPLASEYRPSVPS